MINKNDEIIDEVSSNLDSSNVSQASWDQDNTNGQVSTEELLEPADQDIVSNYVTSSAGEVSKVDKEKQCCVLDSINKSQASRDQDYSTVDIIETSINEQVNTEELLEPVNQDIVSNYVTASADEHESKPAKPGESLVSMEISTGEISKVDKERQRRTNKTLEKIKERIDESNFDPSRTEGPGDRQSLFSQ